MVDDILPDLTNFTATHYITSIKQYFGNEDATRIQNAIGLDFVYEQCFAAKEYNLYGSSRLGVKKDTSLLVNTRFKASNIDSTGAFVKDVVYFNHLQQLDTIKTKRILAFKQFELSNHLGNVLATILDRRTLFDTTIYNSGNDTAALWDADIVSAQDYYPFGMLLPDRIYSADSTGSGGSRYGFNGMERDDEWNGAGNAYTTHFRQYDSRLGRWLSIDPKKSKYPAFSPYSSYSNNPNIFKDQNGDTLYVFGSNADWKKFKSTIENEYAGYIIVTRDDNNQVHFGWIDPFVESNSDEEYQFKTQNLLAYQKASKNDDGFKLLMDATNHSKDVKVLLTNADIKVSIDNFRGMLVDGTHQTVDIGDIEAYNKAPNVSSYALTMHELFEAYTDQAVNGSPQAVGSSRSARVAFQKNNIFAPLHKKALALQAKLDGVDEAYNLYIAPGDLGATTTESWFITGKKDASGKMNWSVTIFETSGNNPVSGSMKTYDTNISVSFNSAGDVTNVTNSTTSSGNKVFKR